jgi:cold shock CspA family protein
MTEEKKQYGSEIGKVLWFDRKIGYGFIKVVSETENKGKELFSHYSQLVSDNPRKYLLPDETVSLDIEHNPEEEEKKRYSCKNITGVFGSTLMCDSEKYYYKVLIKRTS